MEKIGLFDLIDKITTPSSGGKSFDNPPKSQPSRPQNREKENETLRDPDFGAQPQYMMNAKMQAFIKRHEALKSQALKNGKNDDSAKK